MGKFTLDELRYRQNLPLDIKVAMTKTRIRDWISFYGSDGVYVSFSGGKDSTVLINIVREIDEDIPAVFIDTGLEYPEIREFVKTFDNVEILKPKMNFRKVIEEYGYPFISKEVSDRVDGARKYIKILTDRQTDSIIQIKNARTAMMIGCYEKGWSKKENFPSFDTSIKNWWRYASITGQLEINGERSLYNNEKYSFLLDAPFNISAKCCNVMKKNPTKEYSKTTGRMPITAQMACESRQRQSQWLKNGCNGFDMKSPISNPMSFWTEQDVLNYIKQNKIKICSVYGDIVEDNENTNQIDGQMNISDFIECENNIKLKTTGCSRTGCMFCGYGCHLEKGEGRFEMMKKTHPKQYEWIMKKWEYGGLGYKDVIDWINENGNLNIKY